MDLKAAWIFAVTLGAVIGGLVGFWIQISKIKKMELEKERLKLTIEKLKRETISSDKVIITPSKEELALNKTEQIKHQEALHRDHHYKDLIMGEQAKASQSCFPAWTLVLTPTGWKKIADICEGELVISLSKGDEIVASPVLKVKQHEPVLLTKIHFANSKPIYTTFIHSFKTERGFIRANCLKLSDQLLNVDRKGVLQSSQVLQVQKTYDKAPVYNLIVQGNYSYVVEGYVASSYSYFREFRIFVSEASYLFARIFNKRKFKTSQIDTI